MGSPAEEHFVRAALSPDDIAKLTVSDIATDTEKALIYVAGQPVQQRFLLDNLPGLVASGGPPAFAAVFEQLAQLASTADEDAQAALAEALAGILRAQLLPAIDVAGAILPVVLPKALGAAGGSNHANSSPQLHDAWLGCFGELAAALDQHSLQSRVLPAVLQVAGTAGGAPVPARCACCRLLGLLASVLPGEVVEAVLLHPTAALCQDVEWEVRRAMCEQLPAVAGGLPRGRAAGTNPLAIEAVMHELAQLLDDEEVAVRAGAWRTLAALLQAGLVPLALRHDVALPRLLAKCRATDLRLEIYRALTEVFGGLMGRLVGDMEGEGDVNTCLSAFRSWAWKHDAASRANCAAGFLPVLKAATARRYASHLHDTLVRLATDPDPGVRTTVAASLHEVAALLGRERCVQYLRPSLSALLGEDCVGVRMALAAHLVPLLEQFYVPNAELRSKVYGELVEPLLGLEAESGRNWRLQLDLLSALAEFPRYFGVDALYDKFLPVAVKHMGGGAAAALVGPAADAVAAIWRSCPAPTRGAGTGTGALQQQQQQRTALYGRLVREFAQGVSWRQRAAFADFCGHALRRFSCAFFKVYLLAPCSLLAFDPVPNVQLRVCTLMSALKQTISLPGDVSQLEQLNAAMSHLLASADPDVSQAARLANQQFKQQAVRTPRGGGTIGVGTPGDSAAAAAVGMDRQDAAKFVGERELVFDQDLLDRIRADMEAYDRARRPAPPSGAAMSLSLPVTRADGGSPRTVRRPSRSNSSSSGGGGGGTSREPRLLSGSQAPSTQGAKAPAAATAGAPSAAAAATAAGVLHRRAVSDTDSKAGGQLSKQQRAGQQVGRATCDAGLSDRSKMSAPPALHQHHHGPAGGSRGGAAPHKAAPAGPSMRVQLQQLSPLGGVLASGGRAGNPEDASRTAVAAEALAAAAARHSAGAAAAASACHGDGVAAGSNTIWGGQAAQLSRVSPTGAMGRSPTPGISASSTCTSSKDEAASSKPVAQLRRVTTTGAVGRERDSPGPGPASHGAGAVHGAASSRSKPVGSRSQASPQLRRVTTTGAMGQDRTCHTTSISATHSAGASLAASSNTRASGSSEAAPTPDCKPSPQLRPSSHSMVASTKGQLPS